ncbi:MAG: endolytic transglycosylase MltG [Lachnospiraceae bacterium]|nr:endolytic transglycosylase MltG [Lachnospiraceae bacterium]
MKKLLIKIGTTILKLAGIALAVFVLYKVSLFAYDYGYRIFAEEPVDREPGIDINVAIVEGKSVKEIGQLLQEKGLIRDGKLFVLQEKLSEYSGDLRPGQYTLNTSQTPYEMMAIMAATDEERMQMELQRQQEAESALAEAEGSEGDSEGGENAEGQTESGPDTVNTDEGTAEAGKTDEGIILIDNGGN